MNRFFRTFSSRTQMKGSTWGGNYADVHKLTVSYPGQERNPRFIITGRTSRGTTGAEIELDVAAAEAVWKELRDFLCRVRKDEREAR